MDTQDPTKTTTAPSNGGKVSAAQSLASQIQRLSDSVDWWNSAVLVMVGVAALAATGLFATQYVAVKRARRLTDAQAELVAAKDAQLQTELKSKDVEIEALKLARAKIEEKLAPRRLSAEQQHAVAAKLRPFAGQHVWLFWITGDPEIARIAEEIAGALLSPDGAAWVGPITPGMVFGSVGGVEIELGEKADARSVAAAKALRGALAAEGLAVTMPDARMPQPEGTTGTPSAPIKITVGKKP